MKTFIFLLVTLAISVSSGVNGQLRPYFISVYDEGEILPVPKECPKIQDPKTTVQIAHETDCDKFYKCSFGKKVLMQCPKNLHFNPRKQVCDFPEVAGCALTGGSEPTTPSTEPTTPSTEKPTPKPTPPTEPTTPSTEKPTPKPTPPTEPTTPSTEKPTPKPTPPTEPTTPSTEKPTPKPTPPTEPTTPSTEKPTPKPTPPTEPTTPSTEKPTPKPTPPTEPTTPSTEKPTPKPTPPTEPTTPSTEKPTPEPTPPTPPTEPGYPTSCPKVDPEESIVLPHECVCEKYYKCRNGDQILQECGEGLQFNPATHKCDLPSNVGCVNTPAPTSPIPIIPGECPAVNGDGEKAVHLPHETKCALFYKCDHGKKVRFECPDNLHFNPEKQVCDWPNPKMCTDKSFF